MVLGLSNIQIVIIVIGALIAIYVYKSGGINIDTEKYKAKATDYFYSDSAELWGVILLFVLDKITQAVWGVGFGSLNKNIQFLLLGVGGSFILVNKVWGAEKVVRTMYDPNLKAMLNLNPKHKGNVDILIGDEDAVEDEFKVKGADELHSKPAGPRGNANMLVSRGIDRAKGIAIATWRALYDPLEIEESEALIEANSYLLEKELDEAREVKRRNLIHKHKSKKNAEEITQAMWDEEFSTDEEITHKDLQAQSYDEYNPDEFDVKGVKEKNREDMDEDTKERLDEQQKALEDLDTDTDTDGEQEREGE